MQKAVRRGFVRTVELVADRLFEKGDNSWLRSRTVVITFEECWPLASALSMGRDKSSRRDGLVHVATAAKEKNAAGLGALAYALNAGDQSMFDCVPDKRILKIVSDGLERPDGFFAWALSQKMGGSADDVIWSARRYLSAATWEWDKACILAGALLATLEKVPTVVPAAPPVGDFPYWVALDKHTPEGKAALAAVAKEAKSSYRQIIWASFYFESACVNELLPSPWWEAERAWRLRRAGLTLQQAERLWLTTRPLVRARLEDDAARLRRLVETSPSMHVVPAQKGFA